MYRSSGVALASGIAVSCLVFAPLAAQAFSFNPPASTEIDKYLIVGMKKSANGNAVNVQNTELGADRQFLSDGGSILNTADHGGPNTRDVFQERWSMNGGSATQVPIGAADVFEGIDWSGNVAVASSTGRFSMSDLDLFADIGVQCARTNVSSCKQSVSNTYYFGDQQTSHNGKVNRNVGISNFDSSALLGELTTWKTFINDLTAEYTITENIENQNGKHGSGPFVTDLNALDADDNGLVVIDIKVDGGNSDFEVTNSDWILQGSAEKQAIFRIQGESNFNLSQSSILLGDSGIGTDGSSSDVNKLGAIFVKSDENAEGKDSSDQIFNFNNVVLNGIGLWDLVTVGDEGTTEININNGQGCAQFLSSTVTFKDVRWNKCSKFFAAPKPVRIEPVPTNTKIPEPAGGLGLLVVGVAASRLKRSQTTQLG